MLANFHSVGREPSLSKFIEEITEWRINLANCFLKCSGWNFVWARSFVYIETRQNSWTWLVVNIKSHSSGLAWTSSTQSGRQMSASCVKTNTKYWLNNLTILLDEFAEIRLPSSAAVDITPGTFRCFGFHFRIDQERFGLDLKSDSISEKKSHVPRVFYTWLHVERRSLNFDLK